MKIYSNRHQLWEVNIRSCGCADLCLFFLGFNSEVVSFLDRIVLTSAFAALCFLNGVEIVLIPDVDD